MEISGEYRIPAPQQRVWDALNDADVLRRSMPGCKTLDRTGAHEFTATVAARIGPVSATFKGKVELADLDPPNGYVLTGRGQGGAAGFAKGSARVSLEPEGDETILRYEAEVDVGGKLAAVGSRLIGGVAKNMADAFFGNFASVVTGGAPAQVRSEEAAPQPSANSLATPPASSFVAPTPAVAPTFLFVDRLAWLVAGMGLGMLAMLRHLGRI